MEKHIANTDATAKQRAEKPNKSFKPMLGIPKKNKADVLDVIMAFGIVDTIREP